MYQQYLVYPPHLFGSPNKNGASMIMGQRKYFSLIIHHTVSITSINTTFIST